MKRVLSRKLGLMFAIVLAATGISMGLSLTALGQTDAPAPWAAQPFSSQVDLKAFGELALFTEGRVKSVDSFARRMMQLVSGTRRIAGQTQTFTYLDMMLRPEAYDDADVIWVKNKLMRVQVADVLRTSLNAGLDAAPMPEAKARMADAITAINKRLEVFINTGLISPRMLNDDRVHELMAGLSTDLLRSAKLVEALDAAMNIMQPESLKFGLRMVAPPGGDEQSRWLTLSDLASPQSGADLSKMDAQLLEQINAAWDAFTRGWQLQDAPAVNAAAGQLSELLPKVNPDLYPARSRLAWEAWYFRMHNMTWVWIIYGLAMLPLLLAIVFRWPAARWLGLFMFFAAFALHTFAVMLRWYVADRWPNSNMFEAVTTSAWFGGCAAIVFEHCVRRTPMRNIFALGSATASMFALMAVHFMPLALTPDVSNMMPVLNDVWLYIHTNVIIFSYCLIFIAAVSAVIYLAYRIVAAAGKWQGRAEYARVGGAGSLMLTRPDGASYLGDGRASFGQVLDGTTMVVMEASFILLWTGLCMGAIWADHSWGRPWGWDPKEVFALNTFIIFLVLVHVRLKVKDKGLWTAILAVIGAAVMIFNWVIINFAISGLHSYA